MPFSYFSCLLDKEKLFPQFMDHIPVLGHDPTPRIPKNRNPHKEKKGRNHILSLSLSLSLLLKNN